MPDLVVEHSSILHVLPTVPCVLYARDDPGKVFQRPVEILDRKGRTGPGSCVDLTFPLRTLSPGLGSAVLQVLAGTQSGLSATQIARLASRGTRVGQVPVLNRLVEHGLVLAEPANRGFLYRLNREHVLASAIMHAVNARSTVPQRLRDTARELQPAPVHLSVFGSFARAEAGPDSDIDLLIVSPAQADPGEQWALQVQSLADRVVGWTGNRVEQVVLTVDRLAEVVVADAPVIRSWLADSIAVHGPPLSELVSMLHDPAVRTAAR